MTISNLAGRSSFAYEALAATLDNLAVGVIIVSEGNWIVHANRAAAQMFTRGCPVRSVNGRLSTRDAAAVDPLAKAIAFALHWESEIGDTGIGVVLGSALRGPAIAHVLPLAWSDLNKRPVAKATAAVFIMPAVRRAAVNLAAVSGCLGLTPSEARLLQKLESGATLPEAAGALGIADTTAKTHLTHIFAKAGVSRQIDLIDLIHRFVPPVQKPAAG
jgi:DNA-binding CsgD family transcriptional regulator